MCVCVCVCVCLLSHSVMSDSAAPWTVCSLPDSSAHGDSLGQNTGVGCHALLQKIFPTQVSNPGLLHCRKILYCLSHHITYSFCCTAGANTLCKEIVLNNEKVLVTQSCLTFCDSNNCSLPGSSVHGILQARILEWVAMPSSRRSSQPRYPTQVSCISDGFFTV